MKRNWLKEIVRDSRKSAPYESRRSISRRNKVNQIVGRVASGLAGDESNLDDLMNKAAIDELVDRYYQPEEFPTADAMTEMGTWDSPRGKIVIAASLLLLGGLFLYCRR